MPGSKKIGKVKKAMYENNVFENLLSLQQETTIPLKDR
jgi:hypothetical protein